MSSVLKIISDSNCSIYCDTEFIGDAYENKIYRLELGKGSFFLEFISTENKAAKIEIDYVMVNSDIEDLLRIKLNDVINTQNELSRSIEDERILNSREIRLHEGKLCIYDIDTLVIIELSCTEAYDFNEGLAAVKVNMLWGFINMKGDTIIDYLYSDAKSFDNGIAFVKLDEFWGAIDKSGEIIIGFLFDCIDNFINGYARIYKNNKVGYVDMQGRVIVSCKYDLIGEFKDGFAQITKRCGGFEAKYGLIDLSGKEIVACKYDGLIGKFKNGLAQVSIKDSIGKETYGFIDKNGYERIPCRYDFAWSFDMPITGVELNGKWGFIDLNGKIIIDFKYSQIEPFKNGISAVNIGGWQSGYFFCGGKWGGVNEFGVEEITCKYDNSDYIKR